MKKWTNLFLGASLALTSACGGGGSNNDQGTSFSLIGFNSVDANNVCQNGVFVTALSLGISDGSLAETGDVGAFSCATIQNNMTTQFVRADRIFMEFFVPGATQQPPSTSTALGIILGPNVVPVGGGAGGGQQIIVGPGGSTIIGPPPFTSLPASFTAGAAAAGGAGGAGGGGGAAPTATVGFNAVPVEVREWIALNRLSLPEPPFQMTLVAQIAGVTSSGDSLVTNESTLLIVVTPDNLITPTTGQGGDGTATFENGTTEFFTDDSLDSETDSAPSGDESSDDSLDFDFN